LIRNEDAFKYIADENNYSDRELVYMNIDSRSMADKLVFGRKLTEKYGMVYVPSKVSGSAQTFLEGVSRENASATYEDLMDSNKDSVAEEIKKYGVDNDTIGAYFYANNEIDTLLKGLKKTAPEINIEASKILRLDNLSIKGSKIKIKTITLEKC
jgi:hypothetical protein